MVSRTVGSDEALLRLFIAYEGGNCVRANTLEIWQEIAAYIRDGGEYQFYQRHRCLSSEPTGQFYSDLEHLVRAGYVRLLPNSRVEVTAIGNCLALGKAVPPSLAGLESRIARLGRSGSNSTH